MLRIGICDDSAQARFVLRAAIERILENRKIQGQIFEFSAGENLLRWFEHHTGELELIFLDHGRLCCKSASQFTGDRY